MNARAIAPVALAAVVAFGFALAHPVRADEDPEVAIGASTSAHLHAKGEIVADQADAAVLEPIARRIERVADPLYTSIFTPGLTYGFHFFIVHDKQPNAFSVPGGDVYVTDAMFHLVRSQEELAGVLCHEVSHDIHHDVVHQILEQERISGVASAVERRLGNGKNRFVDGTVNLLASGVSLHFSRIDETHADLTGSDVCAAAGYNPWGMVWLLERFEQAGYGTGPAWLSNHPSDKKRIADLERHIERNPERFNRFSPSEATATPLSAT